jgi:hypothetical protein
VTVRQAIDQLAHARAQLVREVRGRRAYEGVDLLDDRIGHGREA